MHSTNTREEKTLRQLEHVAANDESLGGTRTFGNLTFCQLISANLCLLSFRIYGRDVYLDKNFSDPQNMFAGLKTEIQLFPAFA